MSTLTHYK